jgi:hypothetical protein
MYIHADDGLVRRFQVHVLFHICLPKEREICGVEDFPFTWPSILAEVTLPCELEASIRGSRGKSRSKLLSVKNHAFFDATKR